MCRLSTGQLRGKRWPLSCRASVLDRIWGSGFKGGVRVIEEFWVQRLREAFTFENLDLEAQGQLQVGLNKVIARLVRFRFLPAPPDVHGENRCFMFSTSTASCLPMLKHYVFARTTWLVRH